MGKRTHSTDAYAKSHAAAASSGTVFDWSSRAKRSGMSHPAGAPGYGGIRESLDLDGKETESVTVVFDVTGSNTEAAGKVWTELPSLFDLIYGQDWLAGKNFNLQFGAIGDATCDQLPAQLFPFERDGITCEQWLRSLVLEGGGGGQSTESYEMMMWLLTHLNRLDAWKRGKKGLLFMIFDEEPYRNVKLSELRDLMNVPDLTDDSLKDINVELGPRMRSKTLKAPGFALPTADVPLKDVAADLMSKYDCYFIICAESSYYHSGSTIKIWEDTFGKERIIRLPDASTIVQLISSLIGMLRGGVARTRILNELKTLPGATAGRMEAISKALAQVGGPSASITPSTATGDPGTKLTRL